MTCERPDRASPAEQRKLGKAARKRVPRSSHAGWSPPPGRPDPAGLLEQQAASRVADLVPVRHGRMLASPFAYFRGAALPMAADLADTPVTGFRVQACGDAHLSNFGVFGSPERRLLFDVNDFDETLPGPWEWDVKRLAASLEIAGRGNGFGRKARRRVVLDSVAAYRAAMSSFAGMSTLGVWYASLSMDELRAQLQQQRPARAVRKKWDRASSRARTSDSMRALAKLTRIVDGEPRIISDPPLIVPARELASGLGRLDAVAMEAQIRAVLKRYRRTLRGSTRVLLDRFQLADTAQKAVGVGSVGTRCWISLMLGPAGDPLFLQVKEAQRSVLACYAGASGYRNQGERVVTGQRLMQASSDIFLGWAHSDAEGDGLARDYYVRQLRDWKFSLDVEAMDPRAMRHYGQLCGWTLARAHARSGQPGMIAGYLGGSAVFDEAIAGFAACYADQNERDYQRLREAARDGRIAVITGV